MPPKVHVYKSSSSSTPLSTLGMVSLSNFSHFSKLVVVSCCDFNLHVPNDIEHLFVCLFSLCVCSLVKYLFKSFAHFLFGCFLITQFSEFFIYSVCKSIYIYIRYNTYIIYAYMHAYISYIYIKIFL